MINIKRTITSYTWHADSVPLLFVEREEIEELIREIVKQVIDSAYKPDLIISIAHSGVSFGRIVAGVFNLPHAIFRAKSYSPKTLGVSEEKHQVAIADGSLFINVDKKLHSLPRNLSDYYQRLLVVDHLIDSGDSIQEVIKTLRSRHLGAYAIKTACMWQKSCSSFKADFIGVIEKPEPHSQKMPWIIEPDDFLISKLRERFNLTSNVV